MALTHVASAAGSLFGHNITIPTPGAAAAGHLVVAVIGCQADYASGIGWPTSAQVVTPSGWTSLGTAERYSGSNPGLILYAYRKFVQAGETAWTFQIVNRSVDPVLYAVSVWTGGDQTTPIEVTTTFSVNTPAATSSVAPSLSPTHTDTILLAGYLCPVNSGSVPTFSTPTGMTARASTTHDTNGGGLAIFSQAIAATGATGTRTSNLSAGTLETIAVSISLRPDQSTPTALPEAFEIECRFHPPSFDQESSPTDLDPLLTYPRDSLARYVARIKRFDFDTLSEIETYAGSAVPTSHTYPAGIREILQDDISIERSIFSEGALGGEGSINLGALTLLNGDGALDDWLDAALDSREIDLWVGGLNPLGVEVDFADYLHFLSARGTTAAPDLNVVHVEMEGGLSLLNRNVQQNLYDGSGGDEGGEDLKGLPKPIGLGTVYNAEPRMVSIVPLRYQFHDGAGAGAARSLDAVYDKGILLSPDLYTTSLANGTFDLLTNPAGRITCDFTGPAAAGDTADTFARWLSTSDGIGPLTFPNDFDNNAWIDFEAASIYDLGLYIREPAKILDKLREVVAPLGFFVPSRLGKLIFGYIAAPTGDPDLDIQPLEIDRLTPRPSTKPFSRFSIGWGRNWTRQEAGELATTVPATTHGRFVVEEFRVESYPAADEPPSAAVLDAFPTAEERPVVQTLLVRGDHASGIAASGFAIYGRPWRMFEVEIGLQALRTDLNRVQRLTYTEPHPTNHEVERSRFGLGSGLLCRLLTITEPTPGCKLLLWALGPALE